MKKKKIASLAVAAEGAHLHPDILDFSYSPELAKHVSSLFTFEAIRGCGMGGSQNLSRRGSGAALGRPWSSSSQSKWRQKK